jgi:hypothetical protein
MAIFNAADDAVKSNFLSFSCQIVSRPNFTITVLYRIEVACQYLKKLFCVEEMSYFLDCIQCSVGLLNSKSNLVETLQSEIKFYPKNIYNFFRQHYEITSSNLDWS